MPARKKRNADKKFNSFVTKIAKAHKVSLSSPVKNELDQIIKFVVSEVARGSAAIHAHYLRKNKTVTPSTIRSSLEAFLKGSLKKKALEFGDSVVIASRANKATKKQERAASKINGRTSEEAEESAA